MSKTKRNGGGNPDQDEMNRIPNNRNHLEVTDNESEPEEMRHELDEAAKDLLGDLTRSITSLKDSSEFDNRLTEFANKLTEVKEIKNSKTAIVRLETILKSGRDLLDDMKQVPESPSKNIETPAETQEELEIKALRTEIIDTLQKINLRIHTLTLNDPGGTQPFYERSQALAHQRVGNSDTESLKRTMEEAQALLQEVNSTTGLPENSPETTKQEPTPEQQNIENQESPLSLEIQEVLNEFNDIEDKVSKLYEELPEELKKTFVEKTGTTPSQHKNSINEWLNKKMANGVIDEKILQELRQLRSNRKRFLTNLPQTIDHWQETNTKHENESNNKSQELITECTRQINRYAELHDQLTPEERRDWDFNIYGQPEAYGLQLEQLSKIESPDERTEKLWSLILEIDQAIHEIKLIRPTETQSTESSESSQAKLRELEPFPAIDADPEVRLDQPPSDEEGARELIPPWELSSSEDIKTEIPVETTREDRESVENLTTEQRAQVKIGLDNFGFWIKEQKGIVMSRALSLFESEKSQDKQDAIRRFVAELAKTYWQDVEDARKKIIETDEIKKIKGAKLRKLGSYASTVSAITKSVRLGFDAGSAFIGTNIFLTPRITMLLGMAFARGAQAAKETRLNNTDFEKSRLGHDEAEEEAESIMDRALSLKTEEKTTNADISKAYEQLVPELLKARLKANPDQAEQVHSGLTQKVASLFVNRRVNKINSKLERIDLDGKLSPEQKTQKKERLFKSLKNDLRDLDRMVAANGNIDAWALGANYLEKGAKFAVNAMVIETLVLGIEKLAHMAFDINQDYSVKTALKHAAERIAGGSHKEPISEKIVSMNGKPFNAPGTEAGARIGHPTATPESNGLPHESQSPIPESPKDASGLMPGEAPPFPFDNPPQEVHGTATLDHATEVKASPATILGLDGKPIATPELKAVDGKTMELATVGKGQGIEHALKRQLQQLFGYDSEQAGIEAHKIAMQEGYFKNGETRVAIPDRAAYVLEKDPTTSKFSVHEYLDGQPAGNSTTLDKAYEYLNGKPGTAIETKTESMDNLAIEPLDKDGAVPLTESLAKESGIQWLDPAKSKDIIYHLSESGFPGQLEGSHFAIVPESELSSLDGYEKLRSLADQAGNNIEFYYADTDGNYTRDYVLYSVDNKFHDINLAHGYGDLPSNNLDIELAKADAYAEFAIDNAVRESGMESAAELLTWAKTGKQFGIEGFSIRDGIVENSGFDRLVSLLKSGRMDLLLDQNKNLSSDQMWVFSRFAPTATNNESLLRILETTNKPSWEFDQKLALGEAMVYDSQTENLDIIDKLLAPGLRGPETTFRWTGGQGYGKLEVNDLANGQKIIIDPSGNPKDAIKIFTPVKGFFGTRLKETSSYDLSNIKDAIKSLKGE